MSFLKPKVAIIGSGYAGLCAARHLKETFDVTVFERQDKIGGLWNYDPETGEDQFGIPRHGSIYENLTTNFPRQIMDFPDFPNKDGLEEQSFIRREDVQKFLENYANHFDLFPLMKFGHYVTSVNPAYQSDPKFEIDYHILNEGGKKADAQCFDKVFVCTGHFTSPDMPMFIDCPLEKQKVIHSHDYRIPEPFRGLTVCIIGAGPSGVDISIDVSSVAKKVYLCYDHKDLSSQQFPQNIDKKEGKSVGFWAEGVKLESKGSEIQFQNLQCEAVIFCTGYKFQFPFLEKHENVRISTSEKRVRPLRKEISHIDFPDSLFFIGLQRQTPLGYLAHSQMLFVLHLLEGKMALLSKDEMEIDEEKEFKRRQNLGIPTRKIRKLGFLHENGKSLFRDYLKDLEETSGMERSVPEVVLAMFEDVVSKSVSTLRQLRYTVIDSENFIVSQDM